MGYGSNWDLGSRRDQVDISERSYKRGPLPQWDERWHKLSKDARGAFLVDVKGPTKTQYQGSPQPSVAVDKIPKAILAELTDAGFVRTAPADKPPKPDRVFAIEETLDFARRIRGIHRFQLLHPTRPGALDPYLNATYYNSRLAEHVTEVLSRNGIDHFNYDDEAVRRYLRNQRWPDWAAKAINDETATRLLKVVRESAKPVPLTELLQSVKDVPAGKARAAYELLVRSLVLVEDLDVKSLDIVTGLVPAVREAGAQASKQPRVRPLVVAENPPFVGTDSSILVDDLRAVLLEIASEPPRVKQNGALFAREEDRFLDSITPLPDWLDSEKSTPKVGRLNSTFARSNDLNFVKDHHEGSEIRLHLAPKGRSWLSASISDQCNEVFELYRKTPKRNAYYDELEDIFGSNAWRYAYAPSYWMTDADFLASSVTVTKRARGKSPKQQSAKTEDLIALREALGRAFLGLPLGVFHTLESVVAHFSHGEQNVLHLGLAVDAVVVHNSGKVVPAIEEEREVVAEMAVRNLVTQRLIPLGCLRIGANEKGDILVARTERLGAYFGLEPMPATTAVAATSGSKVVIQPDFSVVVIGLDTAPLAELAPFCERSTRGAGANGASVLKITKDSVVRAIANGLKPQELLDRLTRLASHDPPANVLREVREWSGWVRKVHVRAMTVVRCPDRATADRVVSALKSQTERLSDTLVALDAARVTPADRKKLKDHGILVEDELPSSPKPKKKAARRRYGY